MKQIRYILMLLVMIGFTACDSDSIDGLSGKYNDITFFDFSNVTVQPTEKLGKGVKALNTTFSDASGNMTLRFGSGNMDVSLVGETYFVNGLVKTADGKEYKAYYKGSMSFIIGEDDPEPSGYTLSIQTSTVEIMDWTTWQTTSYPDVTKYSITICNPNGAQAAYFDVINGNDKTANQPTGTYTIVGDAHEAMQISAGYSLPRLRNGRWYSLS